MTTTIVRPLQDFSKVDGTSLIGQVSVKYSDIVSLFGNPMPGCGYKTDAEWVLELISDSGETHVVTIYNWKNGKSYMGEHGLAVEDIDRWNVGGHSVRSHQLLSSTIRKMLRK